MIKFEKRYRFAKILVAGTIFLSTTLAAVPSFGEELSEKEDALKIEDEEMISDEDQEEVEEMEIIEPTFLDVGVEDFGFKAIEYLVTLGLIEGSPNGKFNPKAPIKRSEIAKIIALDKGYKAPTSYQIKARDITTKHWAYDYMAALEREKILVGSDGLIRPNDNITRAELAVLLNRAYNYAQPPRFYKFTDVKYTHWGYHSINKLATNGITAQGGGSFKPNANVTRAEFALFLARTLDDRFKPKQ